jgi:rod shape-determining protein MreD
MNDNTNLALRLGVLAFVSVLIQIAGVAQIRILGANFDLSPLVVAAAGFLTGALPGALFGFGVGIFLDLAFAQTLGVLALVFTLVGYAAGRVRELRAPEAPFTPLALGAAATAIASCGYAVLEIALGVTSPVSLLLVRDILVGIALNSLIAVPVYSIVRRWLIPVLPEDPRRRRRRAYTTGGLSPLSRL